MGGISSSDSSSNTAGDSGAGVDIQAAAAGLDTGLPNVLRRGAAAEEAQQAKAPQVRSEPSGEHFCADLGGFASARGLAEILARDPLLPGDAHRQEEEFTALMGKQASSQSGPMAMLSSMNLSSQRAWDGRGFEIFADGAARGGAGLGGSLGVAAQWSKNQAGAPLQKNITVVVLSNRLSLESQHAAQLTDVVSQCLVLPSLRLRSVLRS